MPLLRSQEVDVFQRLTERGFEPREFEIVEGFPTSNGARCPALLHRPTGYFFAFRPHEGAYWVEYSPGYDKLVDGYGTAGWDRAVSPKLDEWLGYLRREVEAPDLWGALKQERELVAGEPVVGSNAPFTPEESAELRRQLSEVKQLVRGQYQLTAEQYAAIEARLDYLSDAADRLGRVDWREAFIGALIGLVVQAMVPADPVRDVVTTVLRGVAHMFGHDLPALPGP